MLPFEKSQEGYFQLTENPEIKEKKSQEIVAMKNIWFKTKFRICNNSECRFWNKEFTMKKMKINPHKFIFFKSVLYQTSL